MLRTTYRRQGAGTTEFDYYEKRGNQDGSVDILGWGTYGPSSVLAGQASKNFLDTFKNEAEADAALVEAGINPADVNWNSAFLEPEVGVSEHAPSGYYGGDGGFYEAGEYWGEDDY